MSEQENLKIVGEFFKAWEGGTYAQLRGAYEDFLADDAALLAAMGAHTST